MENKKESKLIKFSALIVVGFVILAFSIVFSLMVSETLKMREIRNQTINATSTSF